MATNLYFNQKVRSEQKLYEDIVIESLKTYGQDVYYLPRDLVNEDKILGDDPVSSFTFQQQLLVSVKLVTNARLSSYCLIVMSIGPIIVQQMCK